MHRDRAFIGTNKVTEPRGPHSVENPKGISQVHKVGFPE